MKVTVERDVLDKILLNQQQAQLDRKAARDEQRDLAKRFAQLSMDFSIFKNNQTKFNTKIEGYLENNEATGQLGLVNQTNLLKEAIKKIDKKIAIFAGVASIVIAIVKMVIDKVDFSQFI